MRVKPVKLSINCDGEILAVYSDDLVGLIDLGAANVTISRASNVEPDANGHWWATMADKCEHLTLPCERGILRADGTVQLGPFKLRSEALAAEVEYLESRLFGASVDSDNPGVLGYGDAPENRSGGICGARK
jgi:hypothetical protein